MSRWRMVRGSLAMRLKALLASSCILRADHRPLIIYASGASQRAVRALMILKLPFE